MAVEGLVIFNDLKQYGGFCLNATGRLFNCWVACLLYAQGNSYGHIEGRKVHLTEVGVPLFPTIQHRLSVKRTDFCCSSQFSTAWNSHWCGRPGLELTSSRYPVQHPNQYITWNHRPYEGKMRWHIEEAVCDLDEWK